jgi:hypothetical protein
MRSIDELNQDELEELRETYFDELLSTDSEALGDITSAKQIPMSNVKQHYEGISFVEEDFFCNLTD